MLYTQIIDTLKKKIPNESWQRIRKFYDVYAHKHKSKIIVLFLGAIISGVIEIFGILMLYWLLQIMTAGSAHLDTHASAKILSKIGIASKEAYIATMGGLITATFLIKNIYIINYYLYQHKVLKVWKADISHTFMERYIHAPYQFLLGYNSATLIKNINSIVGSALNGFVLSAFNFAANIIVAMILVSILYFKYFTITLLVAGILVISTVLQGFFFNRKLQKLGEERDSLLSEQAKSVYQGIHAMKETKVIGRENYFLSTFREVNAKTIENDSRSMFLGRLPSHITEVTIIVAIVIISAVVLTDNSGNLSGTVASLGVLAAIAFRISPLMNRTINAIQGMNKNISSMDTLFAELNKLRQFEIYKDDRDAIEALPFNQKIEVKDVSFRYPKARRRAISGLSFQVNAGEMIGIVGESGAGKTTLVDVLLGLMPPLTGHISVDDIQITSSNVKNWQKNISYVPQNIYLNDATIASNVAFGVAENKIDRARVEEVLRHVQLTEYVETLDEGIDYVVGENGKNFSGGQRQRLGIARALYLDANLLIFDEATAALDVTTENQITEAINSLRGKKTLIIIAHRLSTVFNADRILYLHNGTLQGVGTYAELFQTNAKFAKMARLARILPVEVDA